ncbi:hypothetical protein J3B02_004949 [Coemansia erecta]|uniref:Dynactin subunit 3 n=1 Tax=Coemansia asiatica TaxID=1052880 RepID=A0A9W7XHH6_9FUNG|nr:hypothetical protein LPJ64_003663 [Coemansia asiatica]KAJ2844490.1 hypothetical protein J3B02_004949 [Coemansia erecta]KAJ2858802.1 hypothetical protein FB639_005887 [Coemansia asiatica]
MEILVSRLEALERAVYSAEHHTAVRADNNGSSGAGLVEQVLHIERQLGKVLSENSALGTGLQKYEKLRGSIDGDGDLELSRQMLGVNAKTELILLNDSALRILSDLRTIDGLQAKVNQPEYAAAAELLPRIKTSLEPENEQQMAEFKQAVADISSMVDRYHTEIDALSEMFIQWDRILASMERKVTELENASC